MLPAPYNNRLIIYKCTVYLKGAIQEITFDLPDDRVLSAEALAIQDAGECEGLEIFLQVIVVVVEGYFCELF